ncbi:integral membrane protein [Pyrolobus fumarii 1A]|uniref:Integral membrane protein n=1 Tax=Pyrolobus fumarii (strain DSM 11204 / 1A) TaxID=694429 RepID=G0EH18_PYRF1|nr:hypothetical protein [Pyrolobus fumarii]AEM38468.1 integral membrane protein [Pyrolobus fumarii 1A]
MARGAYGALLVAFASVLWGLIAPVAMLAYSDGWGVVSLAFYSHLVALPVSIAACLRWRTLAPRGLVYGVLLGSMRVSYLASVWVNGAPVAAAALHTAPLIVSLASRASRGVLLLAALSVFGVWLALGAPLSTGPGVTVAIVSALLYALLILYSGRVGSTPLPVALIAQGAALAPVAPLCLLSSCAAMAPWYTPWCLPCYRASLHTPSTYVAWHS